MKERFKRHIMTLDESTNKIALEKYNLEHEVRYAVTLNPSKMSALLKLPAVVLNQYSVQIKTGGIVRKRSTTTYVSYQSYLDKDDYRYREYEITLKIPYNGKHEEFTYSIDKDEYHRLPFIMGQRKIRVNLPLLNIQCLLSYDFSIESNASHGILEIEYMEGEVGLDKILEELYRTYGVVFTNISTGDGIIPAYYKEMEINE